MWILEIGKLLEYKRFSFTFIAFRRRKGGRVECRVRNDANIGYKVSSRGKGSSVKIFPIPPWQHRHRGKGPTCSLQASVTTLPDGTAGGARRGAGAHAAPRRIDSSGPAPVVLPNGCSVCHAPLAVAAAAAAAARLLHACICQCTRYASVIERAAAGRIYAPIHARMACNACEAK